MAVMIDKKPIFHGEAKVWDSFAENLSSEIVVYNHREINGREYDFCLLIDQIGVLVVEVKGWLSDKIVVHGVDDIEVEGFEKPQTSPKKQARAYRFAILDKLEAKYHVSPLVLDMVCYPFISKEEYYNSHLNIISDEATTLFKEDIISPIRLQEKIDALFEKNALIPHANFSVELITKIRSSLEPEYHVSSVENQSVLSYSRLYIKTNRLQENELDSILDEYFEGVKTILFLQDLTDFQQTITKLDKRFQEKNIGVKNNDLKIGYENTVQIDGTQKEYKVFAFELYVYTELDKLFPESIIFDEGKVSEEYQERLKTLSEHTSFNYQQFEIEHADTASNILVKAGAGTGKTFSMVSRVAFLCNKQEDAVSNLDVDIAMVTFTNEAATNMKKRLKAMFANYYILTAQTRFLKYIEGVDRSHISTIHKFAISILREASLYTGLGTNFRITSDQFDREKLYDLYLNQFLEKEIEENPNFENEIPVPVFQIKEKLMDCTKRLSDKSVDVSKIKPAEMGVEVNKTIPYFNKLLMEVAFPAEVAYEENLESSNLMDLKNCLIDLKKAIDNGLDRLESYRIKYLFIDEFQDTDDVQIDIFKKLQKLMNADCRFFIVGDLKQSIYRFRVAKLSAFERIQSDYSSVWAEYRLNRNYRTDCRLLERFDRIFSNMGAEGYLPYSREQDRLQSDVLKETESKEVLVERPCHGKDQEHFKEALVNAVLEQKQKIEKLHKDKDISKEERTIAILVRTNRQVDEVLAALRDRDIQVEINAGGDLFQLISTIDLYKLVLALTHDNDPIFLVNFLETNYVGLHLEYDKLYSLSKENKLLEIKKALDQVFYVRMGKTWDEVVNEVYAQPILFALRNIFEALQPWKNCSTRKSVQRHYIENYEYLIEKITKFSRVDTLTINQVEEYLGINILTGQKELSRAEIVDDEDVHIICQTIHKSKGLEYGTVILPYTDADLQMPNGISLEAEYTGNKLSYYVKFNKDIIEQNSNFDETQEVTEHIADESRILYVALTRAIRNLVWINNLDANVVLSWSAFLKEC